MKLPNYYACHWWDRTTVALLFDQFSDSRYDDGLYLNQFRAQVGYALTPCLEVGVVATENTNRDNVLVFVTPGNFVSTGSLRLSPSVGGYVAGRCGCLQWSVDAGYRHPIDALTLGGALRAAVSDRLAVWSAADYEVEHGSWTGLVGLQYRFGGGRCRLCASCCSCAAVAGSATPSAESGVDMQVVSYQGEEDDSQPFTQLRLPNIRTRRVNTTVAMPFGQTTMLGGLKMFTDGLPGRLGGSLVGRINRPMGLGNIPFVGRLFKNAGSGQQNQNILLLVTPRIIIQEE